MRRVIVESPYAGDVETNVKYAQRALRDCFKRGEAPFASHLLYTQPGVLDDTVPGERSLGIEAGLVWGAQAEATVMYVDYGYSQGMSLGMRRAEQEGRMVEIRIIGKNPPEGCPDCGHINTNAFDVCLTIKPVNEGEDWPIENCCCTNPYHMKEDA